MATGVAALPNTLRNILSLTGEGAKSVVDDIARTTVPISGNALGVAGMLLTPSQLGGGDVIPYAPMTPTIPAPGGWADKSRRLKASIASPAPPASYPTENLDRFQAELNDLYNRTNGNPWADPRYAQRANELVAAIQASKSAVDSIAKNIALGDSGFEETSVPPVSPPTTEPPETDPPKEKPPKPPMNKWARALLEVAGYGGAGYAYGKLRSTADGVGNPPEMDDVVGGWLREDKGNNDMRRAEEEAKSNGLGQAALGGLDYLGAFAVKGAYSLGKGILNAFKGASGPGNLANNLAGGTAWGIGTYLGKNGLSPNYGYAGEKISNSDFAKLKDDEAYLASVGDWVYAVRGDKSRKIAYIKDGKVLNAGRDQDMNKIVFVKDPNGNFSIGKGNVVLPGTLAWNFGDGNAAVLTPHSGALDPDHKAALRSYYSNRYIADLVETPVEAPNADQVKEFAPVEVWPSATQGTQTDNNLQQIKPKKSW